MLLVLNGEQGVGGAGDRFIAEALRGARRAGGDRRQQDRPARPHPHRRGAPGRRRPRPRRRGLPDLRRAAARASARSSSTSSSLLPEGPFLLPARGDLRPARARAARRARARAGAAPHAPGGPARGRGPGRRDRSSATTSSTVRALLWVETESQKGILIGAPRRDDQGDRHGRPPRARARARHARPPRPVGARAPLAGAPTTRCSTGSGSTDLVVPPQQLVAGVERRAPRVTPRA